MYVWAKCILNWKHSDNNIMRIFLPYLEAVSDRHGLRYANSRFRASEQGKFSSTRSSFILRGTIAKTENTDSKNRKGSGNKALSHSTSVPHLRATI